MINGNEVYIIPCESALSNHSLKKFYLIINDSDEFYWAVSATFLGLKSLFRPVMNVLPYSRDNYLSFLSLITSKTEWKAIILLSSFSGCNLFGLTILILHWHEQ